MSSRHTLGPWREFAPCIAGIVDPMYRTIEAGRGLGAGGIGGFSITGLVSPADAALIAAAPDLLQLAHELSIECGECSGTGVMPDGEPCDDPVCCRVREVIARAEGRS